MSDPTPIFVVFGVVIGLIVQFFIIKGAVKAAILETRDDRPTPGHWMQNDESAPPTQ